MTRRRVITTTTRPDGSTLMIVRRSIGAGAALASLVSAIAIVLVINQPAEPTLHCDGVGVEALHNSYGCP